MDEPAAVSFRIPTLMGIETSSSSTGQAERQLRALVEDALVPMAMFDRDMRTLAVSHGYCSLYGVERDQAVGKLHYDLFPALPDRWIEVHRRGLLGETIRCDLDLNVLPDGSSQWLRWTVSPWHADGMTPSGIIIIAEDVTQARTLRSSLHATESMLNALFEGVSIGLAITDAHGRFLRSNAAYQALVGRTEGELRAMCLGSVVHPSDAGRVIASLEPIRQGAEATAESTCRLSRRDGHDVHVEHVLAAIPSIDSVPMRIAVMARDISDQVALAAELREADHMASVGRLGAGIAHDMGNLGFVLRSAVAGLERSLRDLPPEDVGRASIDLISSSIDHVERMTEALRMLSNAAGHDRAPDASTAPEAISVDPAEWWNQASLLLSRAVPRGVDVEGQFDAALPRVAIVPAELTQIMLNLVANAGHAIESRAEGSPAHGTVQIGFRCPRADGTVDIVVADDGIGMAPDTERHAFEPYFSSRRGRGGSGMGLGIVRRLAAAVGGSVLLDTALGIGTTVTVTLPAVP